MTTRTTAIGDAIGEAIEEYVSNMDTSGIQEDIIQQMRDDFVTTYDMEQGIEEYVQNQDLMERYEIERLVEDTQEGPVEDHLTSAPHYTIEEIKELVAEYVAQRSLTARLSSLFAKIRLAFRVRLTLRRG